MTDFRHMAEKDELRREIVALRLGNERLRRALEWYVEATDAELVAFGRARAKQILETKP